MQIEFKLKRILPVFAGLAFLWLIFTVSTFILAEKENPNHAYVPANSSLVLRFDSKSFFESAAYDVLYASQDKSIFRELKAFTQKRSGRPQVQDLGIDLLSDVVAFSQKQGGNQFFGLLFNLSDAQVFNRKMVEMISENQSMASNKEVGLVLFQSPNDPLSKSALKNMAEKLLLSKGKSTHAGKWLAAKKDFLNLEIPGFGNGSLQIGAGSVRAQLENSLLAFQGEFKITGKLPVSPWTLKPDGFHLSTCIFSQEIQDSLKTSWLSKGFDLPELAKISVNYRGTSLRDGVVPQADVLLEFESAFDRRQIIENPESWQKLGFAVSPLGGNEFRLTREQAVYTLLILDEKTIFIGLKTNHVIRSGNDKLFLMQGDLTQITAVEGGGLVAMGLNFYPPYKAGKQFLESIASAHIEFAPKNGKLLLDGKFEFRKGKYPVSESLKLLLSLE